MGRKQDSAKYRGYRTAGIRLKEELMPHLVLHRTERLADMLWAVHEFDKAHIVMLTEEGLIPRPDGIAMLRELRVMEREGVEQARQAAQGGAHSGEQYLIRRLGEEVGGRMHLGRSSGDLDEVAKRMAVRRHLLELMAPLNRFRRTLLERADEHAETIMPGYTQVQNAQPTTLGHWMSMWALALERSFDRVRALYGRVNRSPAGAVILTGSEFALNRPRMAELLGFADALPHTMDAIMSHDLEMEIASVLAILGSDIARLGGDLMLFTSSEFSMMTVPDRFCGTSSFMMQKKNPYAPQEMKAFGAEAVAGAMLAFYVEKDPTGTAILERKRTEQSFWSVFAQAQRRLSDAEEIIAALIVNKERMAELAGAFWGQAADLAGALVRACGLPWRSAHQIVGILVRYSEERGFAPQATTSALIDEAAIEYMDAPVGLPQQAIDEAMDPAACIAKRTLFGGPAAAVARRELPKFKEVLARDEAFREAALSAVAEGQSKLETAIDSLLTA